MYERYLLKKYCNPKTSNLKKNMKKASKVTANKSLLIVTAHLWSLLRLFFTLKLYIVVTSVSTSTYFNTG